MRGKFIALYGINNIGKSTQTSLLVQKLVNSGVRVEYIKYPIYDLDPTGKMLNEILRGKQKHNIQAMINFFEGTLVKKPTSRKKAENVVFRKKEIVQKEIRQKVTEEELQMWYSLNRYQFDPQVKKKLEEGITIVAEDYTGTGLAWGNAKGADLSWLMEVNKFLEKPNLEILMDGKRFLQGKEKVHLHESSDRLIEKARKSFQKLAKKNAWRVVDANQAIDRVSDAIWNEVKPLFEKKEATPTFTSWKSEASNLFGG